MKKLLAALVILTLAATSVFASTQLKFSGTYAIFGGNNGRTVRRATVDLDESSYVVATGKEEATVFGENFTLTMRPNTLAVLSNDGGIGIYVLFGSATLNKDGAKTISLYTPTTYVKLIGRGEYAVVSTDDEELIFNFSRYNLSSYDAVKGIMIDVPAAYGYDYIHSKRVPLDYKYSTTAEEIEQALKTPATPIFIETTVEMEETAVEVTKAVEEATGKTPGTPVFVTVLQTIQEDVETPVEVKTPAVPGGIKVTQTLVIVPDKPVFASAPNQVLVD